MKKMIQIVVVLALGGILCISAAAQDAPGPMPTGLAPASKADLDAVRSHSLPARSILARRAADLPARWINHEFLPSVGQQRYGSCATWASCYYLKGWHEARERNWVHPNLTTQIPSAAFPFSMLATDAVSGTSLPSVFEFLVQHGTSTYEEFPEDQSWFNSAPEESVWKSAARFRAESWSTFRTTPDDDFATLKTMLASGEPVVGVINTAQSFDSYFGGGAISGPGVDNSVIFADIGSSRGGHAVTFIGYDDDREYFNGTETRHGAFLAVNSWGTWWGTECPERGQGGFFWIAYDLMAEPPSAPIDRLGFYTMTDRIGYEPAVFAILDFQHSRRAELGMLLLTGEWASPDWSRSAVIMGGLVSMDGRVAIDLTDKFPTIPAALGLRVTDAYLPQYPGIALGTIREFLVEDVAGRTIRAPGLPLATRDMTENPYGDIVYASLLESEEHSFSVSAASAAASADIDGDGDTDLVLNWQVYLNDGAGNFTAYQRPLARFVGMYGSEGCAFGDFNKDGHPDLAGAWYDPTARLLQIVVFANEGGGDFREIFTHIPLSDYPNASQIDWVDWNGDGELDIATSHRVFLGNGCGYWKNWGNPLPGRTNYPGPPVDINGDGVLDWGWNVRLPDDTFQEIPFIDGGDPMSEIGTAFGDFDGDGRPDLAIIGTHRVVVGTGFSMDPDLRIYHNDGDRFTLVQSGFPAGKENPRLRWADFNNDGRLDLFYTGTRQQSTGYSVSKIPTVRFLVQQEDGSFQNTGTPLVQIAMGPLCIFDMDNDGDLDAFYAGSTIVDSDHPNFSFTSAVVTNRTADPDWLKTANTPPTTPDGLAADIGTGSMTMRWNAATDAETPAASLRYRLRVGRKAGGCDVVSSGDERDLGICQIPGGPGYALSGLPTGYYYWSVQAVDDAGDCSPWSAEQLAIIESSTFSLLGDANHDGLIDVADVLRCANMKNGTILPELDVADLDYDGVVTQDDVLAIADVILGIDYGPLPDGAKRIGPEGGDLEIDGFRLSIPAGAFDKQALVRVTAGTLEDFETSELPVGYSVTGIPGTYHKPLQLWLRDTRTDYTTPPLIAFGTVGYARSLGGTETGYEILEPDAEQENFFLLTIPAPDDIAPGTLLAKEVAHGLALAGEADGGYFDFQGGILGRYWVYVTDNWKIGFPTGTQTVLIENLSNDLDDAYTRFTDPDLRFSYLRRTKWPVSVCVKGGMTADGYQINDVRGINYSKLMINVNILAQDEKRRAAAAHEFFHLVQSLYDPRDRISAAYVAAPHLWLDEAASSWAEELFVGTPGEYIPGVMDDNTHLPFASLAPKAGLGSKDVQNHGYGSASVIRYLQYRPSIGGVYGGFSTLRMMYEKIFAGEKPLNALDNATTLSGFLWLDLCYQAILTGKVYPFDYDALITSLAPKASNVFCNDSTGKKYVTFEFEVAPIGSALYRAYSLIGDTGIDPAESYVVSLRSPKSTALALLRYSKSVKPSLVSTQVQGDDPAYFEVPSAATTLGAGWIYVSLITSHDNYAAPDELRPFRIAMGLAKAGAVDFGAWNVTGNFNYVAFPEIAIGPVTVDGGLLTERNRWHVTGLNNGNILISDSVIWGPYPRWLRIEAPAAVSVGSIDIGDATLSVSSGLTYEAILGWTDDDGKDCEIIYGPSSDPVFEFLVDASMHNAGLAMYVHYTVTTTRNASGASRSGSDAYATCFLNMGLTME